MTVRSLPHYLAHVAAVESRGRIEAAHRVWLREVDPARWGQR